jgi:nucleotide-binding universal stress UspA family protein
VFRRIVVGHDGSEAADAALDLAAQCADEEAVVLLTRVVVTGPLRLRGLKGGARHAQRDAAESELEWLGAGLEGSWRAEARTVEDHSVERGLAVVAEQEGAELIVVGSDRRPGAFRTHAVLGLRLLNGAPCAVAIAAAEGRPEIRHIGVAYDGSPEAELALEAAFTLTAALRAALTLYLVVLSDTEPVALVADPGDAALAAQLARRDAGARLDAAAGRAPDGVNPETVLLTGDASAAIAERVARAGIDLLVIGSRRQGPVQRVLLGSTSRAVAVGVDCALLVTPRVAGRSQRG